MSDNLASTVVEALRRAALLGDGAGMTDGELLERFVQARDDLAFEALVRRHGPMVWSVCRRVLGRAHDAEDAFQATFLVLVCKASCVEPREAVGNWLHGVAYHTALKARAASRKRHRREKQVEHLPEPSARPPDRGEELQPLLDQEVNRLPEKYRLAFVLCDLQGRSRKEVADQLKIPEGTLSSRLATARQRLAKRLARHGLGVSGAALAAVLSQEAATAGVPASVVAATLKTASLGAVGRAARAGVISATVTALADGVLRAMFLHKLKTMAFVLVVLALVALGSALLASGQAAGDGAGGQPAARAEVQQDDAEKNEDKAVDRDKAADRVRAIESEKELLRLQGTWARTSLEYKGGNPRFGQPGLSYVFRGDRFATIEYGREINKGIIKVDPTRKTIDLIITHGAQQGTTREGLYELKDGVLRLGFDPQGKTRPAELRTTPDCTIEIWSYRPRGKAD